MAKPWRAAPQRPYKARDPRITSAIMARVKGKDNKAEVALRKELWNRGFRYRLYKKGMPGRPDLVFVKYKVVVFVDGDFWHGRALLQDGVEGLKRGIRTSRGEWWLKKIGGNVARDRRITELLRKQHWRVLRVWESEVLSNVSRAADKVSKFIQRSTR